jgi:hypothetical protein
MEKLRHFTGLGLSVMILLTLCLAIPISAQVQPEEEAKPEPILRVTIADLNIQGKRTPDEVREALKSVLPAVVDCLQAEHERAGKAPRRIMLRFNLSSNGKVAWCKVIDPPLKTMDGCFCKVLPQMKLAPAGDTISRVTVILEVSMDHLLAP